jgi:chitodextrinase
VDAVTATRSVGVVTHTACAVEKHGHTGVLVGTTSSDCIQSSHDHKCTSTVKMWSGSYDDVEYMN